MSEEIEDAQVSVMIRTLDAWYLATPELVYDTVVAWLESITVACECECNADLSDSILEASEIEIT